jgi:hypothetical protein
LHFRKDKSQLSDEEYSEFHIPDKTYRDKKCMNRVNQDVCYGHACIIAAIQRIEPSVLVLKVTIEMLY